MAIKRMTFRKSQAATLRQNQTWHNFYGALTDRTPMDMRAPAARQPAQSPRSKPRRIEAAERDVKSFVLSFLANHPMVATVILVNSGTAYNENEAPVQFYRVIKGPPVIVDVIGELIDGRSYRIELKKEGWRMAGPNAVHDGAVRERKQLACIEDCRSRGGVGGFVRSVEEARAVIEGAR